MNKKIIAIFGGSFNPPINSHVNLANQIIDQIKYIQKIIFVPVSTKYSKPNLISDEHRYNMLKIICEQNSKFEVSKVELNAEKQPYTLETLEYFKAQNKNSEIYFICGSDNLKEIETWYKAEILLETYKILVLKRNDDNIEEIISSSELLTKYKNSIITLENIKQIPLSSSMIREKIGKGESIENLVPEEVIQYIQKKQLYKYK